MIHETLRYHFDRALQKFSSGKLYEELLSAKKKYFDSVGQINEEDEDFENRMNAFNEWFLLQYVPEGRETPFIEDYIAETQIESYIADSFRSVNHSLFEFTGKNLKRLYTVKDILHGNKIIMAEDVKDFPVLKGEIFLGRTLTFRDGTYLLPGLCLLPQESKGILKKQSRIVAKKKDKTLEQPFLFTVEKLKTKWARYDHVEISKIFVFGSP
ncbi:MAG: hypothetical protein Fur0010_28310 [Bdellovibrio sp.]